MVVHFEENRMARDRATLAESSAPQAGEASVPPDPRRWWALVVIGLVQLMVVLDATIVNIALPSAQRGLDISDGARHWVITAYALAFGGLLVLGGRICDRYGASRVLRAGLVGFAAASTLGGAATAGATLFAARGLQGAFAALLAPAALSLLSTTFTDPRERGTAFGVYGALSSGGAALGLLCGGLLTEYLDWRWCLYVNVPIALVAVLGTATVARSAPGRGGGRVDLPGTVLSCGGLASIVVGFSLAEAHGWTSVPVLVLLIGGLALLALLVWVEARTADPLLPLRVLADRSRGGALLAVGLSQVALFGFFFFMTYYMQAILGYSPMRAGLAFLPLTVATAVGASVIAARLLHRYGPRPLTVGGLLVIAAGMVVLTRLDTGADAVYPTFLLPAQIAIGLGLGLVMMPAMSTATAGVKDADTGVAAAMVNASQQVGGALGTALLNTVATAAAAAWMTDERAGRAGEATVHGYTVALAVAASILVATAVLTAAVMPRQRRPN